MSAPLPAYVDVRIAGENERLAEDFTPSAGPIRVRLPDGTVVPATVSYGERLDDHHVRLWLVR